MSIRFASTTVPFAARNVPVRDDYVVTAESIAWLLEKHTDKRMIALVVPNRELRLRIIALFRTALVALASAPATSTGAPPPEAVVEPVVEAPAVVKPARRRRATKAAPKAS